MNEKLALNDDILMKIEKPARYIGNEVNAVVKDRDSIDVRFCMCFPDVYEIGMSHLGIQILYDMFNKREDTWCERVYSPWTDLDAVMRKEHIPLFALESQDPIKDFDFLGIIDIAVKFWFCSIQLYYFCIGISIFIKCDITDCYTFSVIEFCFIVNPCFCFSKLYLYFCDGSICS